MTEAQVEALQKIADFDHPFVVDEHGMVTDLPQAGVPNYRGVAPVVIEDAHVYAPEVYHSETDDIEIQGDGWEPLVGYTGQYHYNGAVMHASEYIGGGLARDILATPGIYVVVVVNVLPHVAFPHVWSDSGARCTRCGLVGNGTDNGSCPAHPDFECAHLHQDGVDRPHHCLIEERGGDDEDPEPAGWAVLRRINTNPKENDS